jgi:hypothetical protein
VRDRIIAGQRLWVTGHNRTARRRLEPLLAGAMRPGAGPIDLALIAPETTEEWSYFAGKVLSRLARGGEVALVLADEQAEKRKADLSIPAAYRDAAHALGLRKQGIWATSADLIIICFAPVRRTDPSGG